MADSPLYRILLVEDQPLEADFIRQELSDQGYAVTWVQDGLEALRVIRDTLPDLVLLDIRLPKLDGIAVVKQVKADPQTRFIPVIMVTALTELEERVRGLDAGADDYITKPFQSFELLARIRSTLRIRRMYEDLAATRDKLKRTREENRQLRRRSRANILLTRFWDKVRPCGRFSFNGEGHRKPHYGGHPRGNRHRQGTGRPLDPL